MSEYRKIIKQIFQSITEIDRWNDTTLSDAYSIIFHIAISNEYTELTSYCISKYKTNRNINFEKGLRHAENLDKYEIINCLKNRCENDCQYCQFKFEDDDAENDDAENDDAENDDAENDDAENDF